MFILIAAAAAAAQPVANVGYAELMRGEDAAAIAVIKAEDAEAANPAALINLGVASARRGETEVARRYFQAVIDRREIVELETSTGAWVDARTLARRAIAMLDSGGFAAAGHLARK